VVDSTSSDEELSDYDPSVEGYDSEDDSSDPKEHAEENVVQKPDNKRQKVPGKKPLIQSLPPSNKKQGFKDPKPQHYIKLAPLIRGLEYDQGLVLSTRDAKTLWDFLRGPFLSQKMRDDIANGHETIKKCLDELFLSLDPTTMKVIKLNARKKKRVAFSKQDWDQRNNITITSERLPVHGPLYRILTSAECPDIPPTFEKGYERVEQLFKVYSCANLMQHPDSELDLISNPVLLFLSSLPTQLLENVIRHTPHPDPQQQHLPHISLILLLSYIHDIISSTRVRSAAETEHSKTHEYVCNPSISTTISRQLQLNEHLVPKKIEDKDEYCTQLKNALHTMCLNFNHHAKAIIPTLLLGVVDKSRLLSPDENDQGSAFNPFFIKNDSKPIVGALGFWTLTDAITGMVIGLRPVFGRHDTFFTQHNDQSLYRTVDKKGTWLLLNYYAQRVMKINLNQATPVSSLRIPPLLGFLLSQALHNVGGYFLVLLKLCLRVSPLMVYIISLLIRKIQGGWQY
jgi:hypothetical protein